MPPNLNTPRARPPHWLTRPETHLRLIGRVQDAIVSVPVRLKIVGIVMLPVLILGFTLNYWITTGLGDWLSYLLSDQRVSAAMAAGSRSVILVTFLAAMLSIVFSLLLIIMLTRPLDDLHQVAQDVAGGNLTSRARVWNHDEIGKVASSVNLMIDRLVASQVTLESANRRLETLNKVALAAGRELALPGVLDAVLSGALDVMGLTSGWVCLAESDTPGFYLAHHRNLASPMLMHLSGSAPATCRCQDDLLSGDLPAEAAIRPLCDQWASQNTAAVGLAQVIIPLRARGQVVGSINLLCDKGYASDPANLELVTAIGAQAVEIVTNAWLHARLVEKESARRALLDSLVRTQEDERARLARELHDGAGQTLTTLLVRLKSLEKQAPDGALNAGLVRMQELVADSIEQVREISYGLRPPALEAFGLAHALRTLLDDTVVPAGLHVASRLHLDVSLPGDVETSLYRIAQESITNIIRHARAGHVAIELVATPLGVVLRIDDDGCGFDPDMPASPDGQRHLGLMSMQERAEMLGGSMAVYSAVGAGTSIQVRIPLPELAAAEGLPSIDGLAAPRSLGASG